MSCYRLHFIFQAGLHLQSSLPHHLPLQHPHHSGPPLFLPLPLLLQFLPKKIFDILIGICDKIGKTKGLGKHAQQEKNRT